jgi:acetoacetyl-CoA synthetase
VATKTPLWSPRPELAQHTPISKFKKYLHGKRNIQFSDYKSFHAWSIAHREEFWSDLWDFADVVASHKGQNHLSFADDMVKARFFPEAKLNYAENLLSFCRLDQTSNQEIDALVFWSEDKVQYRVSRRELYLQVQACASALKKLGIQKGDRVAGYLPNMPEAVVAMLATASLGAIWSSASPDFGVQGVLDRFGQIEPQVLFAVDGYWYNGKAVDCTSKVCEISKNLPSLKKTVVVPLLQLKISKEMKPWKEFLASADATSRLEFVQVEFSHPLFILFSSGTTGVPKCIVHGHGGTLLQHIKEHRLHGDIRPEDKLLYFTTLGWMMWNWMVTALASGATLLLYDGAPFVKVNGTEGRVLFDFLEQEKGTHFGTSAKFIDSAFKANLKPRETHDLSALRFIFSTGSPLAAEGFDYVYEHIKKDVCLASISGGTDIVSCFMLGNPELPVWRGEIQCAGLGLDVQIFSEEGVQVKQQKGELVCARAFPSMPVYFWNDPDGRKYFDAYFARFPNVWCHGDFVEQTEHDGFIIYGRSDAVLNPGGVRIGTAEIYRQVEKLSEVLESIVIGQEWQNDVRVILFVKLREHEKLTSELENKIKQSIRANCTPRHVPAKILQVIDIPRTKSGKIVELAVRKVVHNEDVKNKESLANPEALDYFRDRLELRN